MKNLTSLIVVLCLLIVLGCKCQSDMFDSAKNETPTPSVAQSSTPSATASPDSPTDNRNRRRDIAASENPLLATGTYIGKGKNVTYNQTGDFLLRIDSVDSDGNVEAYLEASNGLQGKATMTGTIGSDGKLELSGTLDDGQSAAINATVSGSKISAGYGLADSNLKTQSGNFVVTRR